MWRGPSCERSWMQIQCPSCRKRGQKGLIVISYLYPVFSDGVSRVYRSRNLWHRRPEHLFHFIAHDEPPNSHIHGTSAGLWKKTKVPNISYWVIGVEVGLPRGGGQGVKGWDIHDKVPGRIRAIDRANVNLELVGAVQVEVGRGYQTRCIWYLTGGFGQLHIQFLLHFPRCQMPGITGRPNWREYHLLLQADDELCAPFRDTDAHLYDCRTYRWSDILWLARYGSLTSMMERQSINRSIHA